MKKRILLGVGLLALALAGCSEGKPAPTEDSKNDVPVVRVGDISFLSSTLTGEYNVDEAKSIISLTLPNEIEEFNFDVFKFKTDIEGKSVTAEFKNEANEVIDYNQKLKRGLTRYYLDLRCDDYKEVWTIEVTWNRPNEVSLVSATGKTLYKLNEEFLFIDVHYTLNGEEKVKSFMPEDVTGFDSTTVGKKKLSYILEGESYEYEYEVVQKFPEDAYIKLLTSEYYIGSNDTIDIEYELDGKIIKKSFTKEEVYDHLLHEHISLEKFDKPDFISIALLFDGYYFTATLEVKSSESSIKLDSLRRVYNVNDSFVPGKLIVTKDGKSEIVDITLDMIKGLDLTKEGIQSITITYNGEEIAKDILVKSKSTSDLVIPEGDKLDMTKVIKLLALKRVVFSSQYSASELDSLVAEEIKRITEAEASEFELYLMSFGLKATTLDSLITFYTNEGDGIRGGLKFPNDEEERKYFENLSKLLDLFTDDQIAMALSYKKAEEAIKWEDFKASDANNLNESLSITLDDFLKKLQQDALKDAFSHNPIQIDNKLLRDYINIVRGLVYIYKDVRVHYYLNQYEVIDYLFNDQQNLNTIKSYFDLYYKMQDKEKYNRYDYAIYNLLIKNGHEISELMRRYSEVSDDYAILTTVYESYKDSNNSSSFNKNVALRALNNITKVYGPLIDKIKANGSFDMLLSFTSNHSILRLIDRAYNAKSYDFSLIDEVFSETQSGDYFARQDFVAVKKGTSYDDFKEIMETNTQGSDFINVDDIKRNLNIAGNHFAFIATGGRYNRHQFFVYDETNVTAYNDNNSFNLLENYIIYEDNEGLKAMPKSSIYKFYERRFENIDSILYNTSFKFLLDGNNIVTKNLSELQYTISVLNREYNGVDLNILEIKTEYGSFYLGINYVNAKTLVADDFTINTLYNNEIYTAIEAGQEATVYLIFNKYYKVSEATIKPFMYDTHRLGNQEIELTVDGVNYKINVEVVDNRKAKLPKYLNSIDADPDNFEASIDRYRYGSITGGNESISKEELMLVFVDVYGYRDYEFKYTLIKKLRDYIEFKISIIGDGNLVFEDITHGYIKSADIYKKVEVSHVDWSFSFDHEVAFSDFKTDDDIINHLKNLINSNFMFAKGNLYGYIGKDLIADLEYNNIPYEFKLDKRSDVINVSLFINSASTGLEFNIYDKVANRSEINGISVLDYLGHNEVYLPTSLDGYSKEYLMLYFTSIIGHKNKPLRLIIDGKYLKFELSIDETEKFLNDNNADLAVVKDELIVRMNGIESKTLVHYNPEPEPMELSVGIYNDTTHKVLIDILKKANPIQNSYPNINPSIYDNIKVINEEISGDYITYTYTINYIGFTEKRVVKAYYANDFKIVDLKTVNYHGLAKEEINDQNVYKLFIPYVRNLKNDEGYYILGMDINQALKESGFKLSYSYDEASEKINYEIIYSSSSAGRGSIPKDNPFYRDDNSTVWFEMITGDSVYFDKYTEDIKSFTIYDNFNNRDLLEVLKDNCYYIGIGESIYGRGTNVENINSFTLNDQIIITINENEGIISIRSKLSTSGINFKIVNLDKYFITNIEVTNNRNLPNGLNINNIPMYLSITFKCTLPRNGMRIMSTGHVRTIENILKHFTLSETEESYILTPNEGGYYGFTKNIVISKKIK